MLTPETEGDLSDVIKSATGPLSIRGGGFYHIGQIAFGFWRQHQAAFPSR